MIQQETRDNVQELVGDIQTTEFSIAVNESVFQMLTANVYNNRPLAVMREWSTNACDACISAGKEVKYDVHLPTIEEPIFYVRDYGTGLSPKDIVGLFSTMGVSTKRNNSELNGCLGIGRMAGLAVADAFTVESFYNGTLYSYVISIQKGVPVTLFLGEHPTDEENGLKLSVEVSFNHIKSYLEQAAPLYQYFDYKPNLNLKNINVHLDTSAHMSDEWFIIPNTDRYTMNKVVMAQIAYTIPFDSQITTHGFTGVVIKAPSGAVTFNPGRESLSLNSHTIAFLNKAFEKIKEEYIQAATMLLSSCSTDKELVDMYQNISSGAPVEVIDSLPIDAFASAEYQALFKPRWSTGIPSYSYVGMTTGFESLTNNKLILSYKSYWKCTNKALRADEGVGFTSFFTAEHLIMDVKTSTKEIFSSKYQDKTVIVWQRNAKVAIEEAVEAAKAYLTKLGLSYTLASSIVPKTTTKTESVRKGLYVADIKSGVVGMSTKMSEEEMTGQTYLYMKLNNTKPMFEDNNYTLSEYYAAYLMLSKIKSVPAIKGVSKKYLSFVESLDNWVDCETYIKEEMKKAIFFAPFDNTALAPYALNVNELTPIMYPEDLQKYFQAAKSYKDFKNSPYFLWQDSDIAKKFGASLEFFTPPEEVSLEQLWDKYPTVMGILTGKTKDYSRFISESLILRLTFLEGHYALCKDK